MLCCADAVLDACLAQDPNSKVACETAVKDNFMLVRANGGGGGGGGTPARWGPLARKGTLARGGGRAH